LSIILDISDNGELENGVKPSIRSTDRPVIEPSSARESICREISTYRRRAKDRPLMPRNALAVVSHFPSSNVEANSEARALQALSALGQATRLAIFRILVRRQPEGLPAGEIADAIGCPHNTLSTHLSILARAGLVRGSRDGRSIIYRASADGMRNLVGYLVNDCCEGHPELCDVQRSSPATTCCPPASKRKPAGK
jgi:DNA-binding transcriptional ArsR family regulator